MSQDRVAHRARRFGMDINDGSWGSRVAALDLPTRLTEFGLGRTAVLLLSISHAR